MGKIAVTRQHIASEFQRDKETIKRWFSEIGINHNEALSPSEIERFYVKYGNTNQLHSLGLPTRQVELFSQARTGA